MPRESLEEIGKAYQEKNPELAVLLYVSSPSFSPNSSKYIFQDLDKLGNVILKGKPINVYFYDKEKLVRVKRVGLERYKDYYFFQDSIYNWFKKTTLGEKIGFVCPCGKTVLEEIVLQ